MKIRTFTLFLLMAVTVAAFAQKREGVIMQVPEDASSPVLDGVMDEVWDNANVYDIDIAFTAESPTVGLPGETNWRALWDDDGVYVLVTVVDDEFLPNWNSSEPDYQHDKTEIYFDCNYILEDGLGCEGNDNQGHHQYAPAPVEGVLDGTVTVDDRGWSYSMMLDDPNMKVEYFIPWENLDDSEGILVDKTGQVGFDVTVIDRDTGDEARKRAVWQNDGTNDESWANMDDCGIVTFDGAEAGTLIDAIALTGGTIDENNGMLQIVADITPENASNKTLKWTVVEGGTGRGSISSEGMVTAILDGEITVQGESTDGSYVEATATVTISNQIVTRAEINLFRNGYFDELNDDMETPAEWSVPANSVVIDGVCIIDPDTSATEGNVYDLRLQQNGPWGLNTEDMYDLSFVLWADDTARMNVDFEDARSDVSWNRYGTTTHEYSADGQSEWDWTSPTERTRYSFDVQFNEMVDETVHQFQFMLGHHDPTVYIDSVELINRNDLALLTPDYVEVEAITVGGESTVKLGETLTLTADVQPAEATLTDVKWMVEAGSGHATIDAAGVLTPDSVGTVMVKAMAKDDSKVYGEMEVTIDFGVGMEKHKVDMLKVFPNPAIDLLNVVAEFGAEINIYNSVGVSMGSRIANSNTVQIDISDYPAGIYFVKSGNAVARFVK